MIHPDVARHVPEIRELCRQFGVQKLEIFGSAVRDEFDPVTSDVDFIVTYPKDYDFGPWLRNYFAFRNALAQLLERDVDLVMYKASQRRTSFRTRIQSDREELYAA